MASALKLVEKVDSDKSKALEAALAQIDRAFGKGSVMGQFEVSTNEMPTTMNSTMIATLITTITLFSDADCRMPT